MNVTASEDQFIPCLTNASTSSDQSGNFLSMNVTASDADQQMEDLQTSADDADQQMEDLQTSAHGTQLCNRIIYPFKKTLLIAAMTAIACTSLGLVPATVVFHGTLYATGVAGTGVGLILGSMTALAKRSSHYVNVGVLKGRAIGTLLGIAIGAPPALITTAAVAAGSFSVVTPLLSTLQLPGAIYRAATMSNAEINNRDQEMKTMLQNGLRELNEIKDLFSNKVTGLTDSARAELIKPPSDSSYQYRY